MNLSAGKTKQSPDSILKGIMKREKVSATKLATEMKVSGQALRKRLRGDSKFPVDEFIEILGHLGYRINIVKEEDIL